MAIEKTPIGLRLARLRKESGYKNAEELASAVESDSVTRSTIVNVELGRKRDLTVTELLLISKALGVPPVALMIDLDDLFSTESEYPGFESVYRFQLLRWIGGGSTSFAPESLPGTAANLIVDHLEFAIRLSTDGEELRDEAENRRQSNNPKEFELAKKLERRAERFFELAGQELDAIAAITGKPIPAGVREALVLEAESDG